MSKFTTWFAGLVVGIAIVTVLAMAGPRDATIEFKRPLKYEDGTDVGPEDPIEYFVYQAPKGQPKIKVGKIIDTEAVINSGLEPGVEYCFAVTAARVGGKESPQSNEGCKLIEFPIPQAITITVT